jgi:hypothetical protein
MTAAGAALCHWVDNCLEQHKTPERARASATL